VDPLGKRGAVWYLELFEHTREMAFHGSDPITGEQMYRLNDAGWDVAGGLPRYEADRD
jgi:hypothetical protein